MTEVYYGEINATCIIIMILILIASARIKRDERMNAFRGMVISDIIFSLSDMIAGLARGKFFFGARIVLWVANLSYFISSFVVGLYWVMLCMYITHGNLNRKILNIIKGLVIAASLLFISSIFTGLCFTIDRDNLYKRGPMLWAQWAVLIPIVGMPSFVALFLPTKATKRERIVVGTYSLFPLSAMIIQLFVYGITACQVGITISNILIYIFIQSEKVDEEQSRAKLMAELSKTDPLTGLNNRRSFEDRLHELQSSEWAGTLFADLNRLKYTNDTQGHHAGDQLIIGFAEQLRTLFPADELFRVSGDEFVVLSDNREEFDNRSDKLISTAGDSAAIGKCTGAGSDVIKTLSQAEKTMYENKSAFYKRTGNDRRR